jgi:phospholipid-binding lipoprotein MlaA
MNTRRTRLVMATLRLMAIGSCLALGACATTPQSATAPAAATQADSPVTEAQESGRATPEIDPFESVNRKVFAFNDAVDRNLLAPAARGYRAVLPEPVRKCVYNIFANVGDIWSGVNSLLQAKPMDCAQTTMRVATNTVFGIAGCFDVASQIEGLERKNEDFGQTLAVWGASSGPYLVLPIFGPSTVRDTFGLGADMWASPLGRVGHRSDQIGIQATRIISLRASLLDASKVLDDAAPDRYLFYRDAYLQRREYLIYDGNPPERKQTDESWLDDPVAVPAKAAPRAAEPAKTVPQKPESNKP